MQVVPTTQSLTVKLGMMMGLLLVELIINSFVQPSFSLSLQNPKDINFYFLPIQILVLFLTLVMMLVLMWQTFPLRYGLISSLLAEFRLTLLGIVLFISILIPNSVISAVERGLRLSVVLANINSYSETQLWSSSAYQALYYIRYWLYPCYYVLIVSFSIRIVDPVFYRPNKWLK